MRTVAFVLFARKRIPKLFIDLNNNIMKKILLPSRFYLLLLLPLALVGCKASNSTKGAAIGGGSGAVIGGIIGRQSGNTAVGAIIGAGVGGVTGAIIGERMDKQAEELRNDLKDAQVERVGEGIKITFNSGLLFNFDSFVLAPATKGNLEALAGTLNKYEDTEVLIEGHTDTKGSDSYNLELSRKRSEAVADYLVEQQVKADRMTAVGYGEEQATSANDADNRRVEVAIFANKKMKRAAEKGKLSPLN
jgi:outer membrane protein OmpA-like peptidoglycan-associated protein